MSDERYSRQEKIIPRDRLLSIEATVIGCGSIGRQVAIMLAAIGTPKIILYDFDSVDISNVATQGYFHENIDSLKVAVLKNYLEKINPDIEVEVLGRFTLNTEASDTVFCCVDSITTRGMIWEAVKDNAWFFCDGRMAAESLRVLCACDEVGRKHYPSTLFEAKDAYQGSCTAKSTIYCANIAAGFMVSQFTKHLRSMPTDQDMLLNIFGCEITHNC